MVVAARVIPPTAVSVSAAPGVWAAREDPVLPAATVVEVASPWVPQVR
jgi:hypothetical protein